jgi:hypothetical protein
MNNAQKAKQHIEAGCAAIAAAIRVAGPKMQIGELAVAIDREREHERCACKRP